MALIKCPECGNEISDAAKVCPKCGMPNAMCQVDTLKEETAGQGTEIRKNNKRKIVLIAVIASIVAVVVIVCCIIFGLAGKKQGYFLEMPWGEDSEVVVAKSKEYYNEDFLVLGNSNNDGYSGITAIDAYEGMDGVQAIIMLSFDNSKKFEGAMIQLGNDTESMTDEELLNELIKKYKKNYGSGKKIENGYMWETKNSKITIKNESEKFFKISFEQRKK